MSSTFKIEISSRKVNGVFDFDAKKQEFFDLKFSPAFVLELLFIRPRSSCIHIYICMYIYVWASHENEMKFFSMSEKKSRNSKKVWTISTNEQFGNALREEKNAEPRVFGMFVKSVSAMRRLIRIEKLFLLNNDCFRWLRCSLIMLW